MKIFNCGVTFSLLQNLKHHSK